MSLKLTELKKLADFLAETGLEEIEVELSPENGGRVRLKRPGANVSAYAMPAVPVAAAPAATAPAATESDANAFTSPMVGTFYQSPAPEAAAFVNVGDSVKPGQTLCIIEAMKTMNQIESDRAGTVRKILIQNGSPVEFGQPLFVIS